MSRSSLRTVRCFFYLCSVVCRIGVRLTEFIAVLNATPSSMPSSPLQSPKLTTKYSSLLPSSPPFTTLNRRWPATIRGHKIASNEAEPSTFNLFGTRHLQEVNEQLQSGSFGCRRRNSPKPSTFSLVWGCSPPKTLQLLTMTPNLRLPPEFGSFVVVGRRTLTNLIWDRDQLQSVSTKGSIALGAIDYPVVFVPILSPASLL